MARGAKLRAPIILRLAPSAGDSPAECGPSRQLPIANAVLLIHRDQKSPEFPLLDDPFLDQKPEEGFVHEGETSDFLLQLSRPSSQIPRFPPGSA